MLKHHESSWHKAIYTPLGASLTLNLIKCAKISNEFHTRPTPSTSLPRLPFGTLHAPSKLKWINFICKRIKQVPQLEHFVPTLHILHG